MLKLIGFVEISKANTGFTMCYLLRMVLSQNPKCKRTLKPTPKTVNKTRMGRVGIVKIEWDTATDHYRNGTAIPTCNDSIAENGQVLRAYMFIVCLFIYLFIYAREKQIDFTDGQKVTVGFNCWQISETCPSSSRVARRVHCLLIFVKKIFGFFYLPNNCAAYSSMSL